jgi:hypothetical protein
MKEVYLLMKTDKDSNEWHILSCFLDKTKAETASSERNFLLGEHCNNDSYYWIKTIPFKDVP